MSGQTTTIGLALNEFLNKLQNKLSPDTMFVYDENLSIETSITKLRANSERDGVVSNNEFPLFSFKRNVLKYREDGQGRRSVVNRVLDKESGDNLIYKAVNGEIEIEFSHYSNNTFDQEVFEIDYMSEYKSSEDKEIVVDLPNIGELKYYINYEPLTEKIVNMDNIFYKQVSGLIKINGWFFIIKGTYSHIKEIRAKILDMNTNFMISEININSQ